MKFIARFAAAILVCVTALNISLQNAEACSRPPEEIRVRDDLAFDQLIPINGAWAFQVTVQNMSLDGLQVEVRDEADALVPGSISEMEMRHPTEQSWGSTTEHLIIWTPDALLQPEHQYRATARASNMGHLDAIFSTSASELSAPQVAAVIGEPSIQINEQLGKEQCCANPNICGPCGGCLECWPTEYIYVPRIDIEVELPTSDTDLQTFYRVVMSGNSFEIYWNRRGLIERSHDLLNAGSSPYCITLETLTLTTQEVIAETEHCFSSDQLPDYNVRELEGVTRPAICDAPWNEGGEPDAGDVPDAGKESDAGAINPEASGDSDRGCGCSATLNVSSSFLSMMLFFITLGGLRLSLFSRRS